MYRQQNLACSPESYLELKHKVSAKMPHTAGTDYKIVLFGVLQAGKSSFINSIHSAMEGKYKQIEHSAPGERSVTKKFSERRLQETNVWLCDTKGYELESEQCGGPSREEVERILEGEIGHDYEFGNIPDDISLKKKPNLVGIVWDAMAEYDGRLIEELQYVYDSAEKKDIVCCVLLTKVDKLSEEVEKDLATVFHDEKVEGLKQNVRDRLGIESSNIFPMQNYSGQRDSTGINCLALHTLTELLELADVTMQRGNRDDNPRLRAEPWRKNILEDKEVATKSLKSILADVTKTSAIEAINVAVVGLSGSGKSRFINALLSALHGKERPDAPTGQPTKKLTCYKTPFKLHLYDCKGLTTDDQETAVQQLQALVEASTKNIPTNTLPGRVKRWFTPSPKLSQRMHAVILVIDGNNFKPLEPEERSLLQAAFHRVTELRVPCVVAVSNIDKVCQHVKKSPSKMFYCDETLECVQNIEDSDIQVEVCDIIPVLTRHYPRLEEEGGEETRHALLLHALLHVCDKVKDYSAEQPRPRRVTVTSVLQTFVVAVLVMVAAVVLYVFLVR